MLLAHQVVGRRNKNCDTKSCTSTDIRDTDAIRFERFCGCGRHNAWLALFALGLDQRATQNYPMVDLADTISSVAYLVREWSRDIQLELELKPGLSIYSFAVTRMREATTNE